MLTTARRLRKKMMGNGNPSHECSSQTAGFHNKSNKKCKPHQLRFGDNVNEWTNIPQIGCVPGKRSGHAVVATNGKAYLFGGCGDDSECLNDFYAFDFNSHCWIKMTDERGAPSARASFELALGPSEGTIILAGGTAKDGLHGDIYEYSIFTRQWKRIVFETGQDLATEFLSSYGQTLRPYGTSLVGFGGSSGTSYSNATIKMDLRKNVCEEVKTTGSEPSPRYKHQALIVQDLMYIIGGGNYRPRTEHVDVYTLSMQTQEWKVLETVGAVPQARVAHSCVYDDFTGSFLVWGGFNEALERMNDFHCLSLSTLSWSPVNVATGPSGPPPRAFHAASFHDSTLYIFGGADGEKRFSDVWSYRLRHSPPSLMVLAAQSPAITPLATPIVTPTVGRSRANSVVTTAVVSRRNSLIVSPARSRMGSLTSTTQSPLGPAARLPRHRSRSRTTSVSSRHRSRSRTASVLCNENEGVPALVTAGAIMSALEAENVRDGLFAKKRSRTPSNASMRKIAPFFCSNHSDEKITTVMMTKSPMEFMIPGEGIIPAEILNGIQGLAFGADGFSHGLPKESRPASCLSPSASIRTGA
mmetsp:Transcript_40723/g.66626  ORF Transcript_40723/g.66626 Transcript_40723/m.66626 type:complete len:584 (+) Transcript_40723:111-1862(+)